MVHICIILLSALVFSEEVSDPLQSAASSEKEAELVSLNNQAKTKGSCKKEITYRENEAGVIPCVFNRGEVIPVGNLMPSYNAPAGIHLCQDWNFSLDGSFIWWQARQLGLDMGFVIPSNSNVKQGTNLYSHFNFHPGFRLGLGMDIRYDGWETFANYTRLYVSENVASGIPSWAEGIEPAWLADAYNNGTTSGPPTADVITANENWSLGYNMVHFGLARPSYVGRTLILSPNAGFCVGLITEKLLIQYFVRGSGTIFNKLKQMSHLFGPKIGMDGKILFGYGLRFEGGSGFGFLYDIVKAYMKRQDFSSPSNLQLNMSDRFRFFAPCASMTMGLGWGRYLAQNKWYLDLSLAYELHYYWHQNWMRHMKDDIDQRVASEAADLTFQGLTTNVKFNF